MTITSNASTASRSGGLRHAIFTLDVYLSDYKDFLHTERFNEMHSNCDAEAMYHTRNVVDRDAALDAWLRLWLTGADAVGSWKNTTFDMSTCSLYIVKKNAALRRD